MSLFISTQLEIIPIIWKYNVNPIANAKPEDFSQSTVTVFFRILRATIIIIISVA